MENGSSLNNGNFDPRLEVLISRLSYAHWQNATVKENTRRCNSAENIHEVIGDPCPRQ